MSLTEAILIAIVIILTFIVLANGRSKSLPTRSRTWDCIDRNTGELTSVKMQYSGRPCKCPKCSVPEKNSLKENAEFFTSCPDTSHIKQELGCSDDDKFSYAVNEFGAPGMEFKDWVASQAVDPQVIKNHAEFVKDRLGGNTQNITGRTYTLGELEADQVNWQGLRRPEATRTCSPTQIPDVDYSWYSTKPKFTWSSS